MKLRTRPTAIAATALAAMISLVPAVVTTAAAGTATTATTTADNPPSGRLVAGTTAEPASLDPIFETNLASTLVFMNLYDTLIEFTPELGYSPQLAESYEIAPDGLSVTFTLRDGVLFHSGREMTADDVLYSFDRLRSEESINRAIYSFVESIEADGNTVTFRLGTPAPEALLSALAVAPSVIMDRETVEEHGDLRRVSGGTGPFELAEWRSGSEIVLHAFPDHWAEGQPKLAELVFRVVPDEISAAAALNAGDLDWFQFSDPLAATAIAGSSDVVYTEAPSLAYVYVALNVGRAPFDDPAVRQAISYGLDRQEILDIAVEGRGQVTSPITPTQVQLAQPLETFPSYTYDPERAMELLAEAGVEGLEVTLTVNSSNAVMVAAAPVVVDQLARIGIHAEIVAQESTVWLESLTTQNYDLIFGASGGYPNPDVPFLNSFTCEGSWNYSGICDPTFDEAVIAARAATGDERVALYHTVEDRLVNELAPYLYLFTTDSLWGWAANVEGFTPLPLNERRFALVSITE